MINPPFFAHVQYDFHKSENPKARKKGFNIAGAAASVCDNFRISLEQFVFVDESGNALMGQGIEKVEYLSLKTTELLKMTRKVLSNSESLLEINTME